MQRSQTHAGTLEGEVGAGGWHMRWPSQPDSRERESEKALLEKRIRPISPPSVTTAAPPRGGREAPPSFVPPHSGMQQHVFQQGGCPHKHLKTRKGAALWDVLMASRRRALSTGHAEYVITGAIV